jgi:formate hydrogenlyase transcriptional activator
VATWSRSYSSDDRSSERGFEQIIGNSAALETVLEQVVRVAPTQSTVLIEGETGTGKELIARAIHNLSPRCGRPLIKMNCAAIPLDLLESELFGHEKGAFTGAIAQKLGRFEMADKGTLFLDEVGDIPPPLQPKLLRVLQEQEFERLGSGRTHSADVRIVAATNRDLAEMVAHGEFRSDLYYRLNVFPIIVPPLRARQEDIPALVHHFVDIFSRRMNKHIDRIPSDIIPALQSYTWPGNLRELQNLLERAVILANNGVLPNPLARLEPSPRTFWTPTATVHQSINVKGMVPPAQLRREDIVQIVKETMHTLDGGHGVAAEHARKQREQIVRALTDSKGRVGGADGAAARIGINRTTLLGRMKKFGIHAKQYA